MGSLQTSRSGFTLIELSIVLVIIGLIVGGVLVGTALIEAAQMRQQLTQISTINTAVVTFRNKYNCLPGDCATVSQWFGGTTNGNGDQQISGYCDGLQNPVSYPALNGTWCVAGNWTLQAEWFRVFDQLAAAQLFAIERYDTSLFMNNIAGVAYPQQELASGGFAPSTTTYVQPGGVVVGHEPGGHRIRLGKCRPTAWAIFSTTFGCAPPPSLLIPLDTKLDDGSMTTGRAFITNQGYLYDHLVGGMDGRSYCTNYLAPASETSSECAWSIKADF